jgi:hypothetical protein
VRILDLESVKSTNLDAKSTARIPFELIFRFEEVRMYPIPDRDIPIPSSNTHQNYMVLLININNYIKVLQFSNNLKLSSVDYMVMSINFRILLNQS